MDERTAKLAKSDLPLLLVGETGVGKGWTAQEIWHQSNLAKGPFTHVDCGCLAENLVESELFGHERGAFTGADRQRIGRFEAADGGTLFLDEIGNIGLQTQGKLLRAVQDGAFERLGSSATRHSKVRLIAATNLDLSGAIKKGTFRKDLYYRIAGAIIEIPPLRDRPGDIGQFLPDELPEETLAAIMAYPWPGNIRELQTVLKKAWILADGGPITVEHLELPEPTAPQSKLKDIERDSIRAALREAEGHQGRAASLLGISDRVLHYKMRKLGIETARERKEKGGKEYPGHQPKNSD